MEHPHAKSIEAVVKDLNTDTEQGLSASEAKERLKQYGANQLEEQQQKSLFWLFVEQFNTPVAYLLFVAAGLSFAFGDLAEGIAIVVVLLINAVIGFSMEYQARKSMQALQDMDKVHAHVLRDGQKQQIDAEDVVPGDIMILEPGDMVSADIRLFQISEAQINESALTGESVPVDKNTEPLDEETPTADRRNTAFKGTAMTRGKARGIVIATGMETELGNISAMVSSAEEDKTPINKKLNALTKKLIYLVLGMAALLGLSSTVTDKDTYTIIQTSIAWAIAAIPEGLPIVASIALARGMLRLAKKEVVVKRLEAVETLGETNVILTDKTGTLTENRLTVAQLSWPENELNLNQSDVSEEQRDNPFFQHLWKIGVQCNNAEYDPGEGEEEASGDPLEIAILRWSHELDGEQTQSWLSAERAAEDPFDSESAMMGVITKEEDGYYLSAKGAASSILKQCTHQLTESGEEEMQSEGRQHWQQRNDELSNDGLRCLAFAYRKTDDLPQGTDEEAFLHDLVFVGLVGFIDPPQDDVKSAIDASKEAGIRVVMVTGDHPGTAENVGKQVHITHDGETNVVKGKDLPEEVSEEQAQELVKTDIFSRVDPAQKYRIIESFQKAGFIVGMTGDGVNDAPALKKADIGIAMGKRGTEVAKEVASMTLKNDDFSSILQAIREGRIIFGNIRKFIVYQLSYHLSEVLVIAAVSFLFFELVLLPLQLLFLNILTDVFPALALGVGEGRRGIMKQPPKDPEEPILNRSSWRKIVVYGTVMSAFVFAAFYFVQSQWDASFALANNVAFFTLAFAQLLHVLDMRDNDESVFNNQVTRNKYVWMAVAFCMVVVLLAYFVPTLSSLLSLPRMPLAYWAVVGISTVGAILSIQLIKAVFKKL